jgi:hypothetical protein
MEHFRRRCVLEMYIFVLLNTPIYSTHKEVGNFLRSTLYAA